jgi:hypothetical protein
MAKQDACAVKRESARRTVEKIQSADWQLACQGLAECAIIADVEQTEDLLDLELLIPALTHLLGSLRSAVVKETLLCLDVLLARRASEFKEFVSSDTSSLFYALLEKSSFDKKFVMSSARNTLSLLVRSVPTARLLNAAVELTEHSRAQFREQVAVVIHEALLAMEIQEPEAIPSSILVKAIFTLANDAHQGTRRFGRLAARQYQVIFCEENSAETWDLLLQQQLGATLYLLTMKWYRASGHPR